jgi:hypothetical protein
VALDEEAGRVDSVEDGARDLCFASSAASVDSPPRVEPGCRDFVAFDDRVLARRPRLPGGWDRCCEDERAIGLDVAAFVERSGQRVRPGRGGDLEARRQPTLLVGPFDKGDPLSEGLQVGFRSGGRWPERKHGVRTLRYAACEPQSPVAEFGLLERWPGARTEEIEFAGGRGH